MAVNQQAIDQIKLDEAFATETYLPFNECWKSKLLAPSRRLPAFRP